MDALKLNFTTEAIEILQQCDKQLQNFNVDEAEKDRLLGITFNNMACIYKKQNKLQIALSYILKALEQEHKYSNAADLSGSQINLCSILSQQGKHTQALIQAIGAVELLSEVMNEENSEQTYTTVLNDDNADGSVQDVKLKKFMPNMVPKDKMLVVTVSIAQCNLAVQYESLGKVIEGMNWQQKAYQISKNKLGNIHPLTLKFLKNIESLFERQENSIVLIDSRKNQREHSSIKDHLDLNLPKLTDEKFKKISMNIGNPFSQNKVYKKPDNLYMTINEQGFGINKENQSEMYKAYISNPNANSPVKKDIKKMVARLRTEQPTETSPTIQDEFREREEHLHTEGNVINNIETNKLDEQNYLGLRSFHKMMPKIGDLDKGVRKKSQVRSITPLSLRTKLAPLKNESKSEPSPRVSNKLQKQNTMIEEEEKKQSETQAVNQLKGFVEDIIKQEPILFNELLRNEKFKNYVGHISTNN